MWTWTFWKDALERSIATAAQVIIGSGIVEQFPDAAVDWNYAWKLAASAAGLSVLKSIVARKFGNPQDASLVK